MLVKKEVWKEVLKSDDGTHYYVSDKGNVKTRKEKVLTPLINNNGYPMINLVKNGKHQRFSVHRLVAKAFLGEPEDPSLVVNHKDGDKTNNNIENLEYVTSSENTLHAYHNNLCKTGENHGMAKFSNRDTLMIRILCVLGYKFKDIKEEFPYISDSQLRGIIANTRRTYDTKGFLIKSTSSLGDKTLKSALESVKDFNGIPLIVNRDSPEDYVCLSLEDFFKLVEKDKVVGKRVFK